MSFAIQIKVDDPELRFYMQQYPFLTGPDEGKNQQALRALRQGLCLNEQTSGGALERRTPFGANRLQARHSPDVIVLARKNS